MPPSLRPLSRFSQAQNPLFFASFRPTTSPDDLRTTHGERKTMALELAGRKAEEEPADLEVAGPSDRPSALETS